jgi:hypothetical protein
MRRGIRGCRLFDARTTIHSSCGKIVHDVTGMHIARHRMGILWTSAIPIVSARRMELTMLTALVLICSVGVTPDLRDCTRDNATAVMRVPAEFGNPATCFMHGQAYLAETSIGQELAKHDRVKVVCARSETVDTSVRELTAR